MQLSHCLFVCILLLSSFSIQGFVFRCHRPIQQPESVSSVLLFEQQPLKQQRSRRQLLKHAFAGSSLLVTSPFINFSSPLGAAASAASTVSLDGSTLKPLADLPMIRLKLPKNGLGREYVVVQLNIEGQGPFDFMVDSGLTTEMITPHLMDLLKIQSGKSKIIGLAAGGGRENPLIELKNSSLCCGKFLNGSSSLPLPPLHAVVTDFPQEHIDPMHDVQGMIGMELLELFDVDFDFPFDFGHPGKVQRMIW
jgi:hypothetical protein